MYQCENALINLFCYDDLKITLAIICQISVNHYFAKPYKLIVQVHFQKKILKFKQFKLVTKNHIKFKAILGVR
jgi:hypothetical protein